MSARQPVVRTFVPILGERRNAAVQIKIRLDSSQDSGFRDRHELPILAYSVLKLSPVGTHGVLIYRVVRKSLPILKENRNAEVIQVRLD